MPFDKLADDTLITLLALQKIWSLCLACLCHNYKVQTRGTGTSATAKLAADYLNNSQKHEIIWITTVPGPWKVLSAPELLGWSNESPKFQQYFY